jgi:uncharacterized protein YgiM (DUF1202 family)
MCLNLGKRIVWGSIFLFLVALPACKEKPKSGAASEFPDLNAQIRPYVTVENTKIYTGPGPEFRSLGEIKQNSKVQVVGRDGDWLLIVSKKGNPPGYIDINSVKAATAEEKESPPAAVEGRYETVMDTQVHSGPGLHYPVVAHVKKGIKINVVNEERGWLKVESKRGNPPGYVEASLARPVEGR